MIHKYTLKIQINILYSSSSSCINTKRWTKKLKFNSHVWLDLFKFKLKICCNSIILVGTKNIWLYKESLSDCKIYYFKNVSFYSSVIKQKNVFLFIFTMKWKPNLKNSAVLLFRKKWSFDQRERYLSVTLVLNVAQIFRKKISNISKNKQFIDVSSQNRSGL